MLIRTINLPFQPQRIALIKPSALGDIAHSLPVLTALRHASHTVETMRAN